MIRSAFCNDFSITALYIYNKTSNTNNKSYEISSTSVKMVTKSNQKVPISHYKAKEASSQPWDQFQVPTIQLVGLTNTCTTIYTYS